MGSMPDVASGMKTVGCSLECRVLRSTNADLELEKTGAICSN